MEPAPHFWSLTHARGADTRRAERLGAAAGPRGVLVEVALTGDDTGADGVIEEFTAMVRQALEPADD